MKLTAGHVKILFLLLAVTLLIPAMVCAERSQVDLAPLKKQVEALRGLQFKQDVPIEYVTREELRDYLKKQIYQKERQEELASEEATLKAFGFIEPGFDMREFYLKLYTEQTAGLYDYEGRRFFLSRNYIQNSETIKEQEQVEIEKSIIIHELDHALQDQHYNLGALIKKLQKAPLDEVLAAQAVFEGDATYVMFDYMLKSVNLDIECVPPQIFQTMSRMFEPDPATGDILAGSPPHFREISFFPYTAGFSLVRSLKKKGSWERINQLYRSLPVTTAQVLHPGEEETAYTPFKKLMPGRLSGQGRLITRGSLGEFLIGVLFRQYPGKNPDPAAAGWKGDAYTISMEGRKRMLQWTTQWKSDEDSTSAFGSLKALYEARYPGLEWSLDSGGREMKALKKDGMVLVILHKGDMVTVSDSWSAEQH